MRRAGSLVILAMIVGALGPAGARAALPDPPRASSAPGPLSATDRSWQRTPVADADGTSEPRPTAGDAPDAVSGKQTHVVYFVPQGKPDEGLDAVGGPLMLAIDSIRAWFARESSVTGRPSIRPRFDRRANGTWDISFVRGTQPASSYTGIDHVVSDLVAQGYAQTDKRYLVYAAVAAGGPVNEGGICGESYYNAPGFNERHYAVVYLDANAGCGARDFSRNGSASGAGKSETIAAHEWLHNEGIVPLVAPRHCPTAPYHVCTGALWLVPPGGPANLGRIDPESADLQFPLIWRRLGDMELDRGRDDYLDHGLPWKDLRSSPWME